MKSRIKNFFCLLMCLCLFTGPAGADNLFDDEASDETIQEVTEDSLIDTLNTENDAVVNADPAEPSDDQLTEYSYTPLDVVLVLDVSGSMSSLVGSGQQVITLAQEAASIFVSTLFSLSSPSRIGIVAFDDSIYRLTDTSMGLTDENTLVQMIRATRPNGATNTGGAFEEAASLLDDMQRSNTRQVVIMLTDGLPVGDGDPNQYAISAGNALKKDGRFIYTIGLVGGLSDGEKKTARSVLNAGYETRYFEVDNISSANGPRCKMTDMGSYTAVVGVDFEAMLSGIMDNIAVVTSLSDIEGLSVSCLVGSNLELRITDDSGSGCLSSAWLDYSESAPFGSMSVFGDSEQKIATLPAGKYTITMRGSRTGKASYQISGLTGSSMIPKLLFEENDINTHPAQVLRFDIDGDSVIKTDLSWDPLDHTATDPFNGQPTRGSEIAVPGKVSGKTNLYAWKDKKAAVLGSVSKGAYVQVLACSEDGSWLLVAAADKEGRTSRGWMERSAVTSDGYIPTLIQDEEKAYTVSETVVSRTAPAISAPEGRKVKQGETLTAIHAERDAADEEWVYGLLGDKKATAVYLPANALENWTSVSPSGFRIGYAMPTLVWQKTFGGNGYTELMWAASELNGSGVAVSGRTDSSAKPLKAKNGGRDALAMTLTPDGEIEKSTVLGGGDVDSFHCILPAADGYYVSGITRSNNKDFANTWDNETYSGKKKDKTGRSNALIGKLKPDLSVDWMKSFGTGDVSFGFDMVVQTTDGDVVGCGWLTKNKGFVHEGAGGQDFLLVKLTDRGDYVTSTALGDRMEDVPDSAAATDDGGVMIVGKSSDGRSDQGRIFILDGNLQQTNSVTYGGVKDDLFDNIRNLGDGSYIVTGMTASYTSSTDYWAMQIDADGKMIWSKTYGGTGTEEVCGTALLPDGTSLLVGYTTSTDGIIQGATGTGKDAWAVCIDKSGRVLWQYAAGLPGDDWFNAAAVDPVDGGIVLVGVRDAKGKNAKGYAVKLIPPQVLTGQ